MKACSKCCESKPFSEFYRSHSGYPRDGFSYKCKACSAAYYRDNRDRYIERDRRRKVKRLYGLTVEEYDAIIARECAVCGAGPAERKIGLDHCHASGKVRDALCAQCNVALGMADDSPERLEALAAYLRSH